MSAETVTATCPAGHSYPRGNGCPQCKADQNAERNRLIKQAADKLGLPVTAFVAKYGHSAGAAARILGDTRKTGGVRERAAQEKAARITRLEQAAGNKVGIDAAARAEHVSPDGLRRWLRIHRRDDLAEALSAMELPRFPANLPCTGRWDKFTDAIDPAEARAVAHLCQQCPAIDDCAAEATRVPDPTGMIWGGRYIPTRNQRRHEDHSG